MCSFIPAGVGEDKEGQKSTKGAIDRAMRTSAKRGDDDWVGAEKAIAKRRPQSILNSETALLAFSRWVVNDRGSYFADCPRDEKGRCLPSGSAREGFATSKEQEASVKIARGKVRDAPVPSPEAVRAARQELFLAVQGLARAGGESRGGSAASRRKQRESLFNEFGGAEKGYVTCPWTGLKMHWTDDPQINPKGYPKFERGKIFTKNQGGGYQLPNLIPESFAANRSRNDTPLRRENLK